MQVYNLYLDVLRQLFGPAHGGEVGMKETDSMDFLIGNIILVGMLHDDLETQK